MKLPFDEVYLVSLAERQDRYEKCRKAIDYLGWDVKDFRVVKHPFSDFIVKTLGPDLAGIGCNVNNGNILNCTREQYTLVKSAYLRGVETIAIIEDDAQFFKDPAIWEEYLKNIPKDWDILRFNMLRGPETDRVIEANPDKESLWLRQPMQNIVFGAGFYAVNRKGMKYLIEKTDTLYQPLDTALAFMDDPTMKMYIPRLPISLCMEDGFKSDLRCDCHTNEIYTKFRKIKNFDRNNYMQF